MEFIDAAELMNTVVTAILFLFPYHFVSTVLLPITSKKGSKALLPDCNPVKADIKTAEMDIQKRARVVFFFSIVNDVLRIYNTPITLQKEW